MQQVASSRFHCKSPIKERGDLSREPGRQQAACIPDVNLHPNTARYLDRFKTQKTTGQKTLSLEKLATSQLWLQHKNHNVNKFTFPGINHALLKVTFSFTHAIQTIKKKGDFPYRQMPTSQQSSDHMLQGFIHSSMVLCTLQYILLSFPKENF